MTRANSRMTTFALICALPSVAHAWPASMLDLGGATPHVEEKPTFPVPEELGPAIAFWTDVFTKHESHRVVIHDREYMDHVWLVLQLPRDENGKVVETKVRDLIKRTLDDVRSRLRRLEKSPTPKDDQDRVLLAVAEDGSQGLEGAWTRVRAQRGVANKFRAGMKRADKYLKDIRPILKDEGIPPEIAALPFVESMFNRKARSSAGAAGLWQLMPATARDLGLVVNKDRDDRYDVKKSTRAAARMLRQNHRMLGNWPLAITGYNHGPYGVKRAVKKVGSTDLAYLIEHYEKKTWGFASKNFYAEFLAVVQILADHERELEAEKEPLVTKEPPPTHDPLNRPIQPL
jgi:membrane-bound lytic murein transglycosylase D